MTYVLSTDKDRVDRDWLWTELSTNVYWARWRTRADVEAQLENAWRIVGAYDARTGAMVGYARAFSDGVALAYLADVYVHESARGQALGKAMVREMIDAGPGPTSAGCCTPATPMGSIGSLDSAIPTPGIWSDPKFGSSRPSSQWATIS